MQIVARIQRVKIQKIVKKCKELYHNWAIIGLYTIFCIKFKKVFLFFLKPVTKGTNARSVVYQRLFFEICIFSQDTIGYKRYNCVKNVVIPTI